VRAKYKLLGNRTDTGLFEPLCSIRLNCPNYWRSSNVSW